MKNNDIKKALECFHQRILNTDLAEKVTEGEMMSIINALALITSQVQRIKELTEENERLRERNIALEQKLIILGCDEQYFFKPKVKGETANEN